MRFHRIAHRYAKSLFQASQGNLETVEKECQDLKLFIEKTVEVKILLSSPFLKKTVLRHIFKDLLMKMNASPLMQKFVDLLIQKNRLPFLFEIFEAFFSIKQEFEGRIEGTLKAPYKMKTEQVNILNQLISKKLLKNVKLTYCQDKDVLGGFIVELPNYQIDTSIRTQLEDVGRFLKGENIWN